MDWARNVGGKGGGGCGSGSLNLRGSLRLILLVQGLRSIMVMWRSSTSWISITGSISRFVTFCVKTIRMVQYLKKMSTPLLKPPQMPVLSAEAPNLAEGRYLPLSAMLIPQAGVFLGLSKAVWLCPGHWKDAFWKTDKYACDC